MILFYFVLHHSIPYPSLVIRDTLEPEHLFIHFVVVFPLAVHVVTIIYRPVQLPIVGWNIMRGRWNISHNLLCGHVYYACKIV